MKKATVIQLAVRRVYLRHMESGSLKLLARNEIGSKTELFLELRSIAFDDDDFRLLFEEVAAVAAAPSFWKNLQQNKTS